jgi:hypothetical protein
VRRWAFAIFTIGACSPFSSDPGPAATSPGASDASTDAAGEPAGCRTRTPSTATVRYFVGLSYITDFKAVLAYAIDEVVATAKP